MAWRLADGGGGVGPVALRPLGGAGEVTGASEVAVASPVRVWAGNRGGGRENDEMRRFLAQAPASCPEVRLCQRPDLLAN
jgi:hypothetical protein